jgi:hypothetical protein
VSDLQCPARFRLVAGGEHRAGDVGGGAVPAHRLGDDPMEELESLADLYRGEQLVVLVPPEAAARLPALLRPPADGAVEVEVDADGWRRLP